MTISYLGPIRAAGFFWPLSPSFAMPQLRKRPGLKYLQVAPAQKTAKMPTQAATTRRPQCTHMNMNRLYGHHMCYLCGKVSQTHSTATPANALSVDATADYCSFTSSMSC